MFKSQKGITLVALVITIIVLIILATITINIVFNGGLFKAAQEARNFQANAEAYDNEFEANVLQYITDVVRNETGHTLATN